MKTQAKSASKPASSPRQFFGALRETLTGILSDKGVFLMLVIAPVIYGFFYPWPYANETVNKIKVAIVDQDNSALSQTLIRYSDANPYLDPIMVQNETKAQQALWQQDIAGYLIIPNGLEKAVLSNKKASVSVVGNGGYLLLNKNVQLGFSQVIGTVSAGIKIKRQIAHGKSPELTKNNVQAVSLNITPLYNQSEGYGAYVVPAVSVLILQQILLMGSAMLIGTWTEKNRHHTSSMGWLGRIVAISIIGIAIGCFYYGWVFSLQDYARGGNLVGAILLLLIFCPTTVALGCLLGLWFGQRERALQLLIFSAMPLFFISGYPWPVENLPTILQWIRWFSPASSGIHASVQFNQIGTNLAQTAPYLWTLLALGLFYTSLLLHAQKRLNTKNPTSPHWQESTTSTPEGSHH